MTDINIRIEECNSSPIVINAEAIVNIEVSETKDTSMQIGVVEQSPLQISETRETPINIEINDYEQSGMASLLMGMHMNAFNHSLIYHTNRDALNAVTGINTGDQVSSNFDHNELQNTHNLTTDIDHDSLTNYDINKHFLQSQISITESQISDLKNYYLESNPYGFISTETDPTVPSHVKAISLLDISNWDAKEEVLTFSTGLTRTGNTITNNITQYTDSDAISAIQGDASWKATDWDTAYGWGNHAGLYDSAGTASGLLGTHESTYDHGLIATALQSFTETDPVFTAWESSTDYLVSGDNVSELVNDAGYLTEHQDLSGYAQLSGATFTGDISANNLSGTNTGDQDFTPTQRYAFMLSL